MLGYIISDKKNININEHEIKSFDILTDTLTNICIIKNNEILYKNNIIKNAVIYNHIEILEWFVKSRKNIFYRKYDDWVFGDWKILISASEFGNIEILNWIEKNEIFVNDEYVMDAIEQATINNHLNVFEWFKNSKYGLKYCKSVFFHGNIEILEWLKKNNYKIKYDENIVSIIEQKLIFKFFCDNVNIKKAIMWNENFNFKILKLKTKNNYIKGYNKN